jgi:hypothetical protein
VRRARRRRDLHDPAEVHHRDARREVAHHREVVADEEVGEPELLLQVLEQVDHLRLDRNVERGDRLVADDELRVERERPGDADALALAARELVRVAVGEAAVEADLRPSARAPARGGLAVEALCSSSGSAMIEPTVMRGLRLACGSWKIICIRGRSARSASPRAP